jgi:hypothetical protein
VSPVIVSTIPITSGTSKFTNAFIGLTQGPPALFWAPESPCRLLRSWR